MFPQCVHAINLLLTIHCQTSSSTLTEQGSIGLAAAVLLPAISHQKPSWTRPYGEIKAVEGYEGLRWVCLLCKPPSEIHHFGRSSTSTYARHLKSHHKVDEHGDMTMRLKEARLNLIKDLYDKMPEPIHFNKDVWKELVASWIVLGRVSFHQVEIPAFRDMMAYAFAVKLNPKSLMQHLPRSHHTPSAWISELYDQALVHVRASILASNFPVSLEWDTWTSGNHHAIFGLIAHFLDENLNAQHAVLGLPVLLGRHTAVNQVSLLWEYMMRFGISMRLGFTVSDNARTNNKMVSLLKEKLEKEHNIIIRVKDKRLRCTLHIQNLLCKAIVKTKPLGITTDQGSAYSVNNSLHNDRSDAPEVLLHNVQSFSDDKSEDKNTNHDTRENLYEKEKLNTEAAKARWATLSPYGKLKRCLVKITASPQEIQNFTKFVLDSNPNSSLFAPVKGNETRWHGDFFCMDRALLLKDALDL